MDKTKNLYNASIYDTIMHFTKDDTGENSNLELALEAILDAELNRLPRVIAALSDICYAKAEHLRENWQDGSQAKIWEKNAKTLSRILDKLEDIY